MAQLSLATQYQSGTKASMGVSGHEPNGEFWTYQINSIDTIEHLMATPDPSNFYPFEKPNKRKPPAIAITQVDNIGVKKFIGWGTGAFYRPIDNEYSYLALPIHKKLNEQEKPIINITNNGNIVIFDIEQNDKITYETVRLVVQQGNLREEQVVYFKKNQPIHYELETSFKNIVTASVRAHANEINIISELIEVDLDLGGVLENVLPINQSSATRFNHNSNIIKFYDNIGMSIENMVVKREVDGQYSIGGAFIIVETSLIPKMTSNTAPSGIATASTMFGSGYEIYRAFDQTPSSYWSTTSSGGVGWIAYEFASVQIISKYTIQGRSDASDSSPKTWTFEGWDGAMWIILDTRTNETGWTKGQKRTYSFDNNDAYIKYRLNVTANNGRSTLGIAEIEMIEIKHEPVPGGTIIKMIPIPNRETYGDDYSIDVSEV